jgi:hypothetical protein
MPRTKANAETDMQAANLNPYGNTAVAGGQQVFLNINFQGVSPDIDGLLSAIGTKYGAGKVTLENDVAARGVYNLKVVA